MKRCAVGFIIICIIINMVTLAGCMDDGNIDIGGDVYSTKVEREGVAVYGKYIYLDKMSVCRYDMKKNIMSPACTDPECSGDCPLDCVMTYIIGVFFSLSGVHALSVLCLSGACHREGNSC